MSKYAVIAVVLLIIGFFGWKFLNTSIEKPEPQPEVAAQNIKDCGSDISREGDNQNNIDKDCFLEAYSKCEPAKVYREVYPPENKVIKTTATIDGMENNTCRVMVRVEDKYSIPENDIYYCYSVERMPTDEIYNNGAIKIGNCKAGETARKDYIL